MTLEGHGYTGKILHVELDTEKHHVEPLREGTARLFLGGKGLGAYLLYKSMRSGLNPLSPDNPLILATGPLTGTIAPGSSRLCFVTKSPLTGTILHSYVGGHIGPEMKFAGYDAVIIRGKSKQPSTLIIEDAQIYVRSAKKLAGDSTSEATAKLKKQLGDEYRIAVIGPAGERLAPISCILSEGRAAGRGGAGAVMGSKNLKAIAVKGSGGVSVHDPKRFLEVAWTVRRMLRMNRITANRLPEDGTSWVLRHINEGGALPTRNFQTGQFEWADELTGEEWRKNELFKESVACFSCPVACTKIVRWGGTPEYETITMLGINGAGVHDREAIAKADVLCDEYGIDAISMGNIIGFTIELYQRGVLKEEDVRFKLQWGNPQVMLDLIKLIAEQKGIGKVLINGVKRAAEKIGKNAEEFAMHVKGMEIPGYEPRACQGMGLAYAVSDRGACHCRAWTVEKEILGIMGSADPLSSYGKAELVILKEDSTATIDCSGLCLYANFGVMIKDVWRLIVPCTGLPFRDAYELMKLGERVNNLTRVFNVREGLTRKDDTLPKRLLKEPMPKGPAEGKVVDLLPMLEEYYRLRGWTADGVPTKEKLKELDLHNIL